MDVLFELREAAKRGRDPTCSDGTLAILMETAARIGATNFLEIGAGEGLTSAALVLRFGGRAVAIENDPERAERARENFLRLGILEAVTLICEDAAAVLPRLEGTYDLIFLDGAKVQYRRYFPDCRRLLRRGGALVADDVFFLGKDMNAVPKKRKMLAEHLGEFRELLAGDPSFETKFYECGDGVAVGIKR